MEEDLKKEKQSSPPCGPQSIHCSCLMSFGCIILSVSIANLTVPKAQAPDWSIQNQTTNYRAHRALLYPLLLSSSIFLSPVSLPLCPAAVGFMYTRAAVRQY